MKLKDKIKSYSFWVSIASAVILILKVLGNRFGFVVDESMVSDIFTALCSILVLMGIIVVPSAQGGQEQLNNKLASKNTKQNSSTNLIQDINNQKNELTQDETFDTNKTKSNNENQNGFKSTLYENLESSKTKSSEDNEIKEDSSNANLISNPIEQNENLTEENNQSDGMLSVNDDSLSVSENQPEIMQDENYNSSQISDEKKFIFAQTQEESFINDEAKLNDMIEEDKANSQQLANNQVCDSNEIETKFNEADNLSIVYTQDTTEQNNLNSSDENNNASNHVTDENLKQTNILNLKAMFDIAREKFTGDINDYIFELQEEIRKTRERM